MNSYPAILKGKLAIISDGGSVHIPGIRLVRRTIARLETTEKLRPSSIETLELYRRAAALWDAWKAR